MDYFEIICRTCSSEGELRSLFSMGSLKLSEMLTEVSGIEVIENDTYPQYICTICVERLNSAYLFKKQCQEVNKKFKEYLDNLNIKNESITVKEENFFLIEDDLVNNCQSPNNFDIKEHFQTEHYSKPKKKNRQTCQICNKSVVALAQHLRIHKGEKPHVCTVCGRGFTQKGSLTEHILIHTKEKPFKCSQCDNAYTRKRRLNQHVRIKHTSGEKLKSVSERNNIRSGESYERNNIRGGESYECNECHKKFWKKGALAVHKLYHREKSYLCSYCGKGYVFMKQLSIHLRMHTGERPYKCTVCEKSFSMGSSLRTHQLIHNEEKRFKCLYCEKQFTTRGAYKNHRLIHTGDKPFKCDICNQNFRHNHTLKLHIVTHTGERPYTCKLCEKSFTQESALKTHQLTHTGEKRHKCSVCDKKFALKGNLTVHMRTHTGETPYACSVCHKGFHDSSSMKKHTKKHVVAKNEIEQAKSFEVQ